MITNEDFRAALGSAIAKYMKIPIDADKLRGLPDAVADDLMEQYHILPKGSRSIEVEQYKILLANGGGYAGSRYDSSEDLLGDQDNVAIYDGLDDAEASFADLAEKAGETGTGDDFMRRAKIVRRIVLVVGLPFEEVQHGVGSARDGVDG